MSRSKRLGHLTVSLQLQRLTLLLAVLIFAGEAPARGPLVRSGNGRLQAIVRRLYRYLAWGPVVRDAIRRVVLPAVLLTIPLYSASAAPPGSCASKFVGVWTYAGGTTRVNADGTANPTCLLCVAVQTWTCNGDTYIITGPTSYSATLTPDGRQMVGSAGIATRVGGAAVTTKLAPQKSASTDQKDTLAKKKVAATSLPANSTKGTLARGPLVRSRDGRLQAIAIPGAAWCGEVVGIRLEGAPGVFVSDRAFVHKFLAGTRAAVTGECPRAVGIRFHAREGERLTFLGWSSKAGKWALRELPPAIANPTRPPNDMVRREIARIDAQLLNELAGAQHIKFASDAEAGSSHAAWRVSNVTIGLTILDVNRKKPAMLNDLVKQIALRATQSCGSVQTNSFSSTEGKVARNTFICRRPPNSYAYGILAYGSGIQQFVFGLYSPNADLDNGSNLLSVARAFERIIRDDW